MLQLPCPKCRNMIVADSHLRFPPWCVKCGADISVKPEDVAAATPAPQEVLVRMPSLLDASLLPRPPRQAVSTPNPIRQPPHFHGRITTGSGRLFRVYLCEGELLFLDRTPWKPPQVANALAVMFVGVLGTLAVHAATSGDRERAAARLRDMDWADDVTLQIMVDEDANSFRAAPSELSDVRIEPATAWQRWGVFSEKCAAVLAFRHVTSGDVRMELPDEEDVRRAIHELPAFLGPEVRVNARWDLKRQCYVGA